MKITLLGSGSAFVNQKDNFHSNFIIHATDSEGNEKLLLFDAGTTLQESLNYANEKDKSISIENIDAVVISHLHSDHVGGMEFLGFKRYFSTFPFGTSKPKLFGTEEFLDLMWNNSLKGGMQHTNDGLQTLSSYFNINLVNENVTFKYHNLTLTLVRMPHINNKDSLAYGLKIYDGKYTVFISGDTTLDYDYESLYKDVDYIFHDCEFLNYNNSVHSQFRLLKKLPTNIKNKMYLYHYNLNYESYVIQDKEAKLNSFLGLIPPKLSTIVL